MAKQRRGWRQLGVTVAAGVVALPGWAAGLGELTVVSRLGEPLTAYVAVQAAPDELRSLAVQLAEPALYQQAGITPAPIVSAIEARLIRHGSGWAVELKTREPVRDPFANVLLDLHWNGGRIVREYALLIDPPEYALPAAPIAPRREVVPSRAENGAAGGIATAGRAPAPAVPAALRGGAGEKERVVARGETLSEIARAVAPAGVSLEVVLYALWRNNPEAFIGNDPNRLLAGSRLRLPDAAELQAIAPSEARQALQAYVGAFSRHAERLAQRPARVTQLAAVAGQGKVVARSALPDSQVAGGGDQVRVAPTRVAEEKATSFQPGKEASPAAPPPVPEDLLALKGELKEAQERIAALEQALGRMNRLLEVQSELLARLQQGAPSVLPAAGAPASASTVPEPSPASPSAPPPTTPTGAPAASPSLVSPQGEPQAGGAQPPEKPTAPTPEPPEPAPESPKPAPEPPKPPVKPAVTPPAEPAAEPSFIDFLLEEPLLLAGAGGALLLGAGVLLWRRRKAAAAEEPAEPQANRTVTQTMTVATTATELEALKATEPAPSRLSAATGQEVDTSASILGSDFTQVAFNALQSDEGIDPVTEAEVLLAYDRDQQAEEILLDALKQTPERPQIPLKLLEIYGKRGDRERFEHYFGMVAALTGRTGKEWESAVALFERHFGSLPTVWQQPGPTHEPDTGDEAVLSFDATPWAEEAAAPATLQPTSPAESAEERAVAAAAADLPPAESQEAALDFHLDLDLPPVAGKATEPEAKATPGAGEPVQAAGGSDSVLDFPLIEPTNEEPVGFAWADEPSGARTKVSSEGARAVPPGGGAVPAEGEAAFEEAPETFEPLGAVVEEAANPPAEEVLLPNLDFDLPGEEARLSEAPSPTAPPQDLPEGSELPPEETVVLPEQHGADEPTTGGQLNFSQLPDLDLATVVEEAELPAASDAELDSRIQLAQAYLEMEDIEGARELLEEVVREGTPEARARAEALLAQLPG